MMKSPWLSDARLIPDEVMDYIRKIAVHAVEENGYSPEDVWEKIKDKRLRRQPIKNKRDLNKRLHSELKSLQHRTERVISFFHLPETRYAA